MHSCGPSDGYSVLFLPVIRAISIAYVRAIVGPFVTVSGAVHSRPVVFSAHAYGCRWRALSHKLAVPYTVVSAVLVTLRFGLIPRIVGPVAPGVRLTRRRPFTLTFPLLRLLFEVACPRHALPALWRAARGPVGLVG